jgi:hypothetical protein
MRPMRLPLIPVVIAGGLLASCAGQSAIKPAEVLDERTGMTVGALQAPVEFIESAQNAGIARGKRISFAYLGPVEWDRSGDIAYALWIHVAPGTDKPVGDIRAQGALTVLLDDGPLVLVPSDAPAAGSGPYQPIASWGQTSYFKINVELLRRMAASRKLQLDFRAVDQSMVEFTPTHDTHATLTQFLQARGITAD